MKEKFIYLILLLFFTSLLIVSCGSRDSQPWVDFGKLRISSDGRYLEHEDGTPFFWLGDTGWQLFKELSREEVDIYLENRKNLKFNVVMAVLLAEYHDALEKSPPAGLGPNYYGHEPLEDNDPARPLIVTGSSSTEPNDYWDQVDYVLAKAEEKGIYIGVLPCWGWNYVNGGGSRGDLQIFNETNARTYGAFLGERFRDRPNIIWIIGGDDDPELEGDFKNIYRAMVEGIVKGITNKNVVWNQEDSAWDEVLMTFHPRGGRSSSIFFHSDPWLDFNFLQTSHAYIDNPNSYKFITNDRQLKPTKPVLEGEPRYEDHPAWRSGFKEKGTRFRDFDVRQAAYWSVFAGSYGFTYGHHSIWQFRDPDDAEVSSPDRTWQEALTRPGAQQMTILKEFIESRPKGDFLPDQSIIASEIREDSTHLQALRGDSYFYVYDPCGISFQVNMGKLEGIEVQASWFNPRDGKTTPIGRIENSGIKEFDPPGEKKRGNDWVLVMEKIK
jgi:hypothetical protein